jgi:hypothetical protein
MYLPPAFHQALPLHKYASNTHLYLIFVIRAHNERTIIPHTNMARRVVSKKSDKSALYVGLGVKQKH